MTIFGTWQLRITLESIAILVMFRQYSAIYDLWLLFSLLWPRLVGFSHPCCPPPPPPLACKPADRTSPSVFSRSSLSLPATNCQMLLTHLSSLLVNQLLSGNRTRCTPNWRRIFQDSFKWRICCVIAQFSEQPQRVHVWGGRFPCCLFHIWSFAISHELPTGKWQIQIPKMKIRVSSGSNLDQVHVWAQLKYVLTGTSEDKLCLIFVDTVVFLSQVYKVQEST